MFSSIEAGALRKLPTKTLMARLLRLELLFFRAPREGGLLPRVECLEAFVFGAEAGRAAAMVECLKVVSTVDRVATRSAADTDDGASDGEDKWFEDEKEESPGMYSIKRSAVIVTNDLKCRFGVAGNLSRGQKVEVLEVVVLKKEQLVRGRIAEPHHGWISLVSYETGFRWADRGGSRIEPHVMRSDHNSTDSKKDVTENVAGDAGLQKPPKRARAHIHAEESCRQQVKQESGSGDVDPNFVFYKVLAYPKLGMNLQIGRIYTQAELEERGRCSMPPPLGQRELQTWVCRRDIFFQKLKDGAFFCKVGAPPAFDMQMATKCLQPAF